MDSKEEKALLYYFVAKSHKIIFAIYVFARSTGSLDTDAMLLNHDFTNLVCNFSSRLLHVPTTNNPFYNFPKRNSLMSPLISTSVETWLFCTCIIFVYEVFAYLFWWEWRVLQALLWPGSPGVFAAVSVSCCCCESCGQPWDWKCRWQGNPGKT